MKEFFRALDPTRWAMLAAAVALLIVAVLTLSYCSEKDRLKQAKGERDLAQGRTTSAVEAITAIGELGQRAGATDAQVEEAHDAIRQAAPADRDRVARYHLCVLQHRPGCDGMLGTGAGNPDH